MLLNDEEIQERLESPLNLLNRLKGSLSHANKPAKIPSLPPKAEDVISDLEDKISDVTAKTKAKNIMIACMDELEKRVVEIEKPERLAVIAREMAAVANHHEKKDGDRVMAGQIVVYAPQVISLENYNIVDRAE